MLSSQSGQVRYDPPVVKLPVRPYLGDDNHDNAMTGFEFFCRLRCLVRALGGHN